MGLVQNLKKTLSDWGDKILVELSSAYIKQLAKQTLRKQDNSSSTESLQNPLTQEDQRSIIATSSADTSEKITMMETEKIIAHVRSWSLDRASSDDIHMDDARAILEEFYEWIEPESEELEIISLD